jgi:hypothetical protein
LVASLALCSFLHTPKWCGPFSIEGFVSLAARWFSGYKGFHTELARVNNSVLYNRFHTELARVNHSVPYNRWIVLVLVKLASGSVSQLKGGSTPS